MKARKPLRAKHCRSCDRCIARQDQYVSLHGPCACTDFQIHQPLSLGLELRYVSDSYHLPNRQLTVTAEVGLKNHRQFVLFVTTLVGGVISFDYLTYACTSCDIVITARSDSM
jgi:palmitoyltransferase